MPSSENRSSPLRRNPFFVHAALAGLIWVLAAEVGGIKFLAGNGAYLWEGEWSCELLVFQIVRDIFNILDCWFPFALERTMVPDFADGAYFLGVLFAVGSLLGVLSGATGWLTGLIASPAFRNRWHGSAWGFGFQSAVLALALLRHAKGLYFTREVLFHSSITVILAFVIMSALVTLISRLLLDAFFSDSMLRRCCLFLSLPFLIAAPLSYPALRTPTPLPAPAGVDRAFSGNPSAVKYILLITVDTLRYDHTTMGDYHRDTTPAVARLAGEGVSFDSCYSAAPWTLPSMMSLMTGMSPIAHGVEDKSPPLADGVPTLAQIIKRHAYRTAAFYTHYYVSSAYGFDRGYQDYEEFNITQNVNIPTAGEVVEKVLPWLERNHADPFFLAIHFFDPHWSYDPPAPYDSLYDPDYRGPLTGRFDDFRPFLYRKDELSPRDLEHFVALYDGEIKYTDAQIERIFERMKSLGIYDETLIIFTADHGEEFKDHGGLSHEYTVFQEVIHVPLVIRFPDGFASPFPRGSRVQRPTTLLDLGPTILNALGLPPCESFQGVSILSRDMAEGEWNNRNIFSKTDRFNCHTISLIKGDMKYIHGYFTGTALYPDKRWEGLYMLSGDPRERNNLAGDNRDLVESMRREVFRWVKKERGLNKIYGSWEKPVVMSEAVKKRLESLGYIQ